MKISWTALFLCLFLFHNAAEAQHMGIDEAVQLALENNPRIKQFDFLAQSEQSAVRVARGAFFPTLELEYAYGAHEEDKATAGQEHSLFRAMAAINLFNGMADHYSLLGAKASAAAARHRKIAVTADIILATRLAYIDLLAEKSRVETAMESVRLLERQKKDTQQFYTHGLIARNELLRVDVELSTSRQELIAARGRLNTARARLRRYTGSPIETDTQLEDLDVLPVADVQPVVAMIADMLENRSEMKYLGQLKNRSQHQRDALLRGYLPRIDIEAAHANYGDTPAIGGRAVPYNRDATIMVAASWTLFDGQKTQHRINQSDHRIEALEQEIEDTRQDLVLQLESALEAHRVAGGRQAVAETAVHQAGENYRVTHTRFKQREATTTDLLDARFYLIRARNQRSTAFYGIHKAVALLDRISERNTVTARAGAPHSRTDPAAH